MNDLLKNVYVINLERSKDRLKNIDSNLKKYGIKYKRFKCY
jgi:GR25 family glycosyltransferase involved in LPS biosynthesis